MYSAEIDENLEYNNDVDNYKARSGYPMLTAMAIGNKIAEARKRMRLSQAQLAKQLSVSSQAVGKWERGESMPDIITFDRLAEALGVDLNYFSENFQPMQDVSAAEMPTEHAIDGQEKSETKKSDKISGWDMSGGNWVDADFSGLKNLGEKFGSSNIQNCLFVGSDLSGLLLKSNNVERSDFSNSNLSKSCIEASNIVNSHFRECSLKEIHFKVSHIKGCDFSGADFTGAVVESSALLKNKVNGAVWSNTKFRNTKFVDMVFEGSFTDCSFENCDFARVTFQNATFINTFFKNKSLKKIRFLDCKADNLTYAFLKNGKADMADFSLI
jgi:uncharacterized protein YjbI with pentapeptide repeats